MLRVLAPALVAVSVFVLACGGSSSDLSSVGPTITATTAACAPTRPAEPGDHTQTLALDASRRFVVHVPPGYAGGAPVPVILAFPASGMAATVLAGMTGLPAWADEHSVLLVVLESEGESAAWNAGGSPGAPDDVRYVTAVMDAVNESYCIDQARTFAVGYSDGGAMSQAVTCAMPERIAAVALVASTFGACRSGAPLVAFHGLDDAIVPYEGGPHPSDPSREFPSVRRSVTEWAREAGCDALPVVSHPTTEVDLSTFKRCKRGDGAALLYTIIGGGHTWPGRAPLGEEFGFSTQQFSATDTMWEFFQAFPRE